jgi:hypothetical protein
MVTPANSVQLDLSRLPLEAGIVIFIGLLALVVVWWSRERRMARQRRVMRTLYSLGEEMTAGRRSGASRRTGL